MHLLILGGYPVERLGLKQALDRYDGFELVGETDCVDEAVKLAESRQADIIIVDPDWKGITLQAVSSLSEASDARILVFTAATEPNTHAQAIELGASGIVCKDQPAEMLRKAIEKVHQGEIWLDRAKTARLLSLVMRRREDPETAKIRTLTKREREVVGLVGEGLKNTAIAERLFISEATVRNHLTSILAKLELSDRFELAVYAFRNDLVAPPWRTGSPGLLRTDENTTRRAPQYGRAGMERDRSNDR